MAATLITGSSAASAAVLTPVPGGIVNNGPHGTSHPNYGPSHPNCSKWQLERWNLNGSNTIAAVYQGAVFNYTVTFRQNGSCLTGTLTDPYLPATGPQSGPISGTIRGNTVTFSFTYPTNVQGKRTYTGTISRQGAVSGSWSQTGTQVPNNGTWSLGTKANHACPRFWWWNPRHVCFVRGH
ncbi:MAG TPA: hypothetical protein VGL33_22340 [Streptosporangiaceae bacterium]